MDLILNKYEDIESPGQKVVKFYQRIRLLWREKKFHRGGAVKIVKFYQMDKTILSKKLHTGSIGKKMKSYQNYTQRPLA